MTTDPHDIGTGSAADPQVPGRPAAAAPKRRRRRQSPPKVVARTLAQLDGRHPTAIRRRDLVRAMVNDLGGDPSAVQFVLVERAALLTVFCETCEVAWLAGGELDGSYLNACRSLRLIADQLGSERQSHPKPVERCLTMADFDGYSAEQLQAMVAAERAKEVSNDGG